MTDSLRSPLPQSPQGSAAEVFFAFLQLGLTSFGGPVAHLGYFRSEFVERRRWLDDRSYTDLVALCQFLPGPASSQVGMALGLARAGWAGLLVAWLGFTLPSALALMAFALGMAEYQGWALSGWVHGLKVVAVAIVAQAVWGMSRSLCPDRPRVALALLAAGLALWLPSAIGQWAAMAVAGALGWWCLKPSQPGAAQLSVVPVSRTLGGRALALFALLLVGLPVWAAYSGSSMVALVEGVYRAGALVFGGGHVVMPLLQSAVVPAGVVSHAEFLAGYGAVQAVPGPLFTFAAYLGAVAHSPLSGWLGGFVLLVTVFLPGFLILVGVLPFWQSLRHHAGVQTTLAGINAGVVGVLLAALIDPVWSSAIRSGADAGLAVLLLALLTVGRCPPVMVVALAGCAGWGMAAVGW